MDVTLNRTSVQGSDKAPVPCMPDAMLTTPTFAPLDTVAALSAIVLRPEAKVERRDEEDPVEGRACAGVGRVVGFRWAQM